MVAYTEQSVAALRQTVRRLLDGETDVATTASTTDDAAYLAAAERHRLVVFLALRQERLVLTPELARALHESARRERMATLGMARALHEATEALTAAGVRVLSFKGLALAAQAHGDFAARGSGDLDLLVPPADLRAARDALRGRGWVPDPSYPSPGPTWAWRHTVENYHELALHRAGLTVDLHWHLGLSRVLSESFEALWGRRASVSVAGREIATFAAADALQHSADHASKDGWSTLRSLVDVRLLEDAVGSTGLASLKPASRVTLALVAAQLRNNHEERVKTRLLVRAESLQTNAGDASFGRFPGHRTWTGAVRRLRSLRSPADVKRLVAVSFAHPSDLGAVDARTVFGGFLAVGRLRWSAARRRFREWRRT